MLYLCILALLALAGMEGSPLARDKRWAELTVFSFLMVAGIAIITMNTLIFEPFRISMVIDFIFRPYTGFIKGILTGF